MILHIYGQASWHDPVYLVGTRADLMKLQTAIGTALEKGSAKALSFVSDGEGYEIEICCVDEHTAGRLSVPYTEEMAREREGSPLLRPWEIKG